jgi:hypothetical protein
MLYSAILHSLHIKIKFIAYICHEICSSYNFFNDMLEIIKTLFSRRDLNSSSANYTIHTPRYLKV